MIRAGFRRHRWALAAFAALSIASLTACRSRMGNLDRSDAAINARVQAELQADPSIQARYLDVNTHMQTVTVSGMVRSYEEKRRIAHLVRRVPGVRQVLINVLVQE